jgi:mannose-1-phosphate guanylyltransferase
VGTGRPEAILLAAGLGERLRPLTTLRPKPLFPVLNRTQLSYWLDRLQAAGVERVVVNVHHLAGKLLEALAMERRGRPGLELIESLEPERPLGTGGGIGKALRGPLKGGSGPLLIVNVDIRSDLDLLSLLDAHERLGRPPATLALVDRPERATVGLGEGGIILGFRSKTPWPGEVAKLCGAGIMVLEREASELIPEGVSDIVEILGRGPRRPAGVRLPGSLWADMGSPADYLELNRLLAGAARFYGDSPSSPGGLAPHDLAPHGPAPWPGVEVEGFLCAEAGAVVRPGARLKDSILWREAVIGEGAVVEGSVVAAEIGPGERAVGLVVAPGIKRPVRGATSGAAGR